LGITATATLLITQMVVDWALSHSQRNHLIVSPRELVKFFDRKSACSCLKDLYYNLKDNTSKKTWCHVCNERTNVKDIFQWECRIVFYCSRECAKSHGRDMRVNVRNTGCTQCTIQAKNSEIGSAEW
jgi:hypothetical protein